MAKATAKQQPPGPPTGGRSQGKPDRWFKPTKPDFIKLDIGETLTGVYLGRQQSSFGPTYRFQNGSKIEALSGNRVSIDGIMDQVDAAGMKGHLLTVERLENEMSTRGRQVHQYRAGHISQGCPACDRQPGSKMN